jgi:hypothetical protein
MRTDELIDMLGANLEPVKTGRLRATLIVALAIGSASALCLTFAIFGLPADALAEGHFGLKVLALAFTLGLAAAGASFLVRAARPGEPGRTPLILIGLLFLCVIGVAVLELTLVRPSAWSEVLFGPQWAACLVCIPLFAVVPFGALIFALRKGAPTRLMSTGAVAGVVAGALGAAAFAIHHSGGPIAFMALWYGGPIVLCAVIGAILGPRLLRW